MQGFLVPRGALATTGGEPSWQALSFPTLACFSQRKARLGITLSFFKSLDGKILTLKGSCLARSFFLSLRRLRSKSKALEPHFLWRWEHYLPDAQTSEDLFLFDGLFLSRPPQEWRMPAALSSWLPFPRSSKSGERTSGEGPFQAPLPISPVGGLLSDWQKKHRGLLQ